MLRSNVCRAPVLFHISAQQQAACEREQQQAKESWLVHAPLVGQGREALRRA